MTKELTPDRWRTLEPILDALLEYPAEQRLSHARAACAGDESLLADVEQLLATQSSVDSDLDLPAAQSFASLLDDDVVSVPAVLGDRYQMGRMLGRGGMATVFLAQDLRHDRPVAVKVLHPEFAATLGVKRFLAEIRTTAQLHHPHILPLHDSGDAQGLLFYVMPLADASLRSRLQQGPLPHHEAVRIACEIAAALEAAHSNGVVHRDIKPENILFQGTSALVADFGAALALRRSVESRITASGTSPGTPQYMSPEHLRGERTVDGRADIHSLGAVLHEMLSGEPPFVGPTVEAIITKRLAGSATPLPNHVPATLRLVVKRALETDPAERYQSAEEFADALRAALAKDTNDLLARPASVTMHRRRLTVAAGLLLGLVVLAFGARRIFDTRTSSEPSRGQTLRMRPQLVAILPFEVDSPDSSLAFLRDGMPELIAAALTRSPGFVVADQHAVESVMHESAILEWPASSKADGIAKRLGAAHVLAGAVVGSSRRLTIHARMIVTGRADTALSAAATGPLDSISTLVDDLATALLARTVSADEPLFTDLSKRSVQVLRSYVNGRVAFRQGRVSDAAVAFDRALRADSSFGLAALGMAASGAWNTTSLFLRDEKDFRIGWRLRNQLPNVDRTLFDAYVGTKNPSDETDAAELNAWERVYRLAPERPDVAYGYGDRLFHVGAYLGIPDAEQKAANAFANAVSRDSGLYMPLGHLVEIAAGAGDDQRARRLLRLYESGGAEADAAGFLRWEVAVRAGDSTALRALRKQIPRMPTASLRRIISFAQIAGIDVGDGVLALSSLLSRHGTLTERRSDLYRAHALALNRGRSAESGTYLRELHTLRGSDAFLSTVFGDADELRVLDALFSLGDTAEADIAARALSDRRKPGVSRAKGPADVCTLELWRLSRGITSHANESLLDLRASGAESDSARYYGWNPGLCIAMVEALRNVIIRNPNAGASIARLDALMTTGPHQFGSSFGNLLLARLYASQRDYTKALAAVRRRRRDVDDGPLYAADAFAMEMQLLSALKDTIGFQGVRSRYRALRGY